MALYLFIAYWYASGRAFVPLQPCVRVALGLLVALNLVASKKNVAAICLRVGRKGKFVHYSV